MKERVIIFGATDTGKIIYKKIKEEVEVIAFVDEDKRKWGEEIDSIKIYSPDIIQQMDYDMLYIGVLNYYFDVLEVIKKMDVPTRKINANYVQSLIYPRIECMKNVKRLLDEVGITEGAVAELGVFRGDFAKEINKVFCNNKLYLFDTFEGFAEEDYLVELKKGYANQNRAGHFGNTTVQLVMDKMTYPEKCCICKGLFPESAKNVEDRFLFVNLDADLYAPTLAGLEFFYPRMVQGGVIFVHDYFSEVFSGAKGAVKEFCTKENISYLPIGDTLSIAIRKTGR